MLEVTQHGYTAGAPELRYTPSGDPVVNFRVLTTDRWTDRDTGEIQERTTGIRWEVWGKQAENLARLVRRGSQILVRGTIRNDSFEKDGETHYRDRYVVDWWKLLDRKPKEDGAPAEPPAEGRSEGAAGAATAQGSPAGGASEKGKKGKRPAASAGAAKDGQPF